MSNTLSDVASIDIPGSAGHRRDLLDVADFGDNPGQLKMRLFTPGAPHLRPLVVVLHGCAQTAEGYDLASGWTYLAEHYDFLVMYPEQQRANNHGRCFSWFEPSATQRGGKEVESIRQMIETAIARYGADRRHIFVCGLSAGGAMAGAMLAVHPSLFRAGAVIAGLPYGTATNLSEAMESMSSGRIKDAKIWGDHVRAAPAKQDAWWPRVSIWHGTADNVVKPINAGELVKQWTNVHAVGATQPVEDRIGEISRRVWRDAGGDARVTEYSIPGLAHGAPVDERDPPAPFFLPAGISSTRQIAQDWGLLKRNKARQLLSMLGL